MYSIELIHDWIFTIYEVELNKLLNIIIKNYHKKNNKLILLL